MCCRGAFKRLVPFFLTLAVGIFIASLFVDISPFGFKPRRMERWREMQQLRIENDQLRSELEQVRQENNRLKANVRVTKLGSPSGADINIQPVPPPNFDAPPPPPLPRVAPHSAR